MIQYVSYETYIRVVWLWRRDKVSSLIVKGPIISTANTEDTIILFKLNDHVVKDNATHDTVGCVF
jgi:hypothetical protein